MADETPVLVFYIENTQPYNVIDITEVTIPFYVEITDLAHDSDLIEIEDLPIPAVACYIENSKVFNITMDSSGRDGKDGLPGKDGISLPGKDGESITFETLTPEQLALLLQPATNAAADLYETITQLQQQRDWFFLDYDGNIGTNYNLYSTEGVSAYGVGVDGGGGTGGGLILNVYGYIDLGVTYDDAILTNTFNAYTINLINERLIAVEDGGSHIGLYEPKNANIQYHISSKSNPHNITKELLNLGNVLNVASYSKSESDALLSSKLDAETFDRLFEKVNIGTSATPKYAIKAKYDFYSVGEVSAFGAGTGGSSGGGLIETVYGYSSLGGTFDEDTLTDTFNAHTINKINTDLGSRINSLEAGSALNFNTIGDGNAVTSVDRSETNVTITKGITFSVDGHGHTFGSLTGKPTTLSGYGITDGLAISIYTAHKNNQDEEKHVTADNLDVLSHLSIVNGALQVDIDFYSTGGVSAYGIGTDGGGGGVGSFVAWGITTTNYAELTVEGAGKNVSLSGHKHKIADINSLTSALAGKEPAITKLTAFNKNFGTKAGTVAQGDDSRINNGQTAFGWGNHALAGYALNSALTTHINKVDNPHAVTKSQIGLGNVENTSDANKPVSTAMQTALNFKLDKSIFDDLFEKVEVSTGVYAIKANYNFYSVGEVSAFGAGTGSGTGDSGGSMVVWETESAEAVSLMVESVTKTLSLASHTHSGYALNSSLSNYVPTSRTINPGNGLTGGGSLSANRTLTLGTPSSITSTSTNSVTTTSHTHLLKMGSGSGLDADTIDLLHASDILVTVNKPSNPTLGQEWVDLTTGVKYTWLIDTAAPTEGWWVELGSPALSTSASLKFLTDVTLTNILNGNILKYNGSKWVNISPLDLPISTATNTALGLKADKTYVDEQLNLKANLNSPTFTGTVSGISKAMVGLSNVNDTADSAKNVASAAIWTTTRSIKIGSTSKNVNGSVNVSWNLNEIGAQPLNSDLTAIAALTETIGLLKKTATNTWTLDTAQYTRKHTLSFTTNSSGAYTISPNPWGTDILIRLKRTSGIVVNVVGISIFPSSIVFGSLDPSTQYDCLIIY